MDGGGGLPRQGDTDMSDASGAPHRQPTPPGMESTPATLSHGWRFIQFNIFELLLFFCDVVIIISSLNSETNERVDIMKIVNAFDSKIDAKRTLRLIKLLRRRKPIDVWSVGCIFMELMNRQPLFPGRDHVQQLRLLMELMGTPSEAELGFLNENAKSYIRQLPLYHWQSFIDKYPHVHRDTINLVEKMLTFDPRLRITVEDALAHPYLNSLHDISNEPTCVTPFSFNFEQHKLLEEEMKQLIYREALTSNPEYQ